MAGAETLDRLAFAHLHQPELIVYDLPRPYERHWNVLRLLKETDSLKAATWVLDVVAAVAKRCPLTLVD